MPDARGSILVIRGGAIGDFILTLPVLAALRRQFPDTRLELLAYPRVAPLALAAGLADAARSIDARPLAGFFARRGELAPDLQHYFAGFAIILSYLYDPDGIFRDNIARCSKAQFIAGPHRPDETAPTHATETFLQPLTRLAIFDPDPIPRLPLDPRPSALDHIALHPGSGSEKKNWPEEHWAVLLRQLIETTPAPLLLVGGEAEGDRLQRLAAPLPPARIELAHNLPLPDLAARLRASRAFVGHDSGITHLAAALGVPVLALWGETNEAVWRPLGKTVTVLRHDAGLAAMPVELVASAVNRMLNHRDG